MYRLKVKAAFVCRVAQHEATHALSGDCSIAQQVYVLSFTAVFWAAAAVQGATY